MIQMILRGLGMCLLVCLAGCSQALVGDWRSVEPAEVPPEVSRIRQVTFDSDGRFQARLLQHHRMTTIAGSYQYTGERLMLTPQEYADRNRYDYSVRLMGNVLALTQGNRTYHLCRESTAPSATRPALPVLDPVTTQPGTAGPPAE